MSTEDLQYTPAAQIAFSKLDEEEGVLLHLDTKQYYTLNETGLLIWEHLSEGASVQGIAEALTASYDVELDEAIPYVHSFLEELAGADLVVKEMQ